MTSPAHELSVAVADANRAAWMRSQAELEAWRSLAQHLMAHMGLPPDCCAPFYAAVLA